VIKVEGDGRLRRNPLELQRALEVAQIILYLEPHPQAWTLRYGEVPEVGQRIDCVMELRYDENVVKRIGVEVVSSEEEVERALSKLRWMIAVGSLDKGYVYVRSLEEVQKDVSAKLTRFIKVGA